MDNSKILVFVIIENFNQLLCFIGRIISWIIFQVHLNVRPEFSYCSETLQVQEKLSNFNWFFPTSLAVSNFAWLFLTWAETFQLPYLKTRMIRDVSLENTRLISKSRKLNGLIELTSINDQRCQKYWKNIFEKIDKKSRDCLHF